MANGVAFSPEVAHRIANAVRKVERTPQDMAGDRNRPAPQETSFWAFLSSGGGMNGLFWSWVKVVPVERPPTAGDPVTVEEVPLWDFSDPIVSGYQTAREANNIRNVPPGTVALLTFMGYDQAGDPLYVFSYNAPLPPATDGIHDHRDNITGQGFAFAVYHPGTDLPQQPWNV
jgi:hypothetical protein